MSVPEAPLRCWSSTHCGTVRTHNEDALVCRPEAGLWAVADGAGGHESGELASATVAHVLGALPATLAAGEMLSRLRLAMAEAHEMLLAEAARRLPPAMIATTVVMLLIRGNHFVSLWVGDSRAYLLRNGVLRQITRDHSLVQALVDSGALDEAAAERHPQANVITRAVGQAEGGLDVDKVSGVLQPGDRFLLCSDGLSKALDNRDLASGLAMADELIDPAEALVTHALARGARDNITAIVLDFRPGERSDLFRSTK